ncbi:cupin domain-containing protein [Maribacter sp. HTCC2170]|uniref:cupin domain-containing protein n=1 Tax=Maribacter sp. (strain HTCC2170 / KCCM 42371) TaxID=313603 RepID=UPI00006B1B22|nr:cupin domain-containing protein [Maribacter sp. HTCC2170]EAR00777.1 putative cupin [Maribacter sp. HTCC2170]
MSKYWKFVKDSETIKERVLGRDHYWHFNADMTNQADTYMVKVVMPVGGMHNFHRHPEMNEILYILKGTAEQWVENERQILKAGDSVYIDPNVVHGTFNIGDEDLEFLAILAPSFGWETGTIDEYQNLPYSEYRKDL